MSLEESNLERQQEEIEVLFSIYDGNISLGWATKNIVTLHTIFKGIKLSKASTSLFRFRV